MNFKKIFLILFAVLYVCVCAVSMLHAIQFFGLANSNFLSVVLAGAFEIGQAAVLFSILTNNGGNKKFIPWLLMIILTTVQIMGNVFSSYRYLLTNSTTDLIYFKEPIFMWTTLPDAQCNVILSYIMGGILPLVALLLTAMVTNYLTPKSAEFTDDRIISDADENASEPTKDYTDEVSTIDAPTVEPISQENESHFINL